MTRWKHWVGVVSILSVAGLGSAGRARAQVGEGPSPVNLEGFTVAGKGQVAAKPNRLEIELEISASSEMTADVIVKYRDAKKRLQDAFTTLKMSNVEVEEKALAVDQKGQSFNPYSMDSAPSKKGKVEIQLSRKLVLKCNEIRELDEEALLQLVGKLLDVAQDAGAKVGRSPDPMAYWYGNYSTDNGLIRFILDDFEALEEKAYEAAVADAKTRAGRLAKLNGVDLGAVAGVREVVVPGERSSEIYSRFGNSQSSEEETPKKRLETSKFQKLPIKVELLVRFTTVPTRKAGKETGQ